MRAFFLCVIFSMNVAWLAQVAQAERLQLKTGEWLSTSAYGQAIPFGGEPMLTLSVTFETKADEVLREQSLQELVTKHLLPSAMRQGYAEARLLEDRTGISLGIFTARISENWDFRWKERYQWEQTNGPQIEWDLIRQELYLDETLGVRRPAKVIFKRFDTGHYNIIINSVTASDMTPEESARKAVGVLYKSIGCDGADVPSLEVIEDPKLNGIFAFVRPKQRANLLDIVPSVSFSLGRIDGEWICEPNASLELVSKSNWTEKRTWDDFVPSLQSRP